VLVEFEFSWMTYFVSLFVLLVCSIALSLLFPGAGRRDDSAARSHNADAPPPAQDESHDASRPGADAQPHQNALPAHPGDGA
jgi:hypothetical protein